MGINSTLRSLTTLSGSIPEYDRLRLKSLIVLPMAKPVVEGYQYAYKIHYTTFIEDLRTLISHKLEWTASEESFFPKSVFFNSELKGITHELKTLESMFYMQGFETVIEKFLELYSHFSSPVNGPVSNQNEREAEEKLGTIGVKNKKEIKPEAHLTIKTLGLQKLYSIDEELVQIIIKKVSESIIEDGLLDKGVEAEYFKILDLFGSEYILPTESGMPVYLAIQNPLVTYNKGEVEIEFSKSKPSGELSIISVTNYKRQIHAGVMSSLTEKFHSVGVETSVHVAIPLEAEVTYEKGQVRLTLKQSEEPEYETEYPIFEFDIHPFTTSHPFSEFVSLNKGQFVKTIKSQTPDLRRELNIGKPVGLDAKIMLETEQLPQDMYSIWEQLSINIPLLTATPLPLPVTSNKRTRITLTQNPRTSEVKELDLFFTVGYGNLEGKNQQSIIKLYNDTIEDKIDESCEE